MPQDYAESRKLFSTFVVAQGETVHIGEASAETWYDTVFKQTCELWPCAMAHPLPFAQLLIETSRRVPNLNTLHLPDLFLSALVLSGDPEALREFDALLTQVTERVFRRNSGLSVEFADVKQCVFTKCTLATEMSTPKLKEYLGRSRLEAWLGVVTTGMALNLNRSQKPTEALDPEKVDVIFEKHPELQTLRSTNQNLFRASFTKAVASLSSKERNLLRLRFLNKVSLLELASFYQVHRATVVRWLAEVTERLEQQTRANLVKENVIRPSELTSFVRGVGSVAPFSIESMLQSLSSSE